MAATKEKSKLVEKIKHLNPCSDAATWLKTQKSAKGAWKSCERADWMLWLLGRLSGGPGSDARRTLVLCACEVARTSLKFVKAGEERPRLAIELAERWAQGDPGVSLDDVRKSGSAAHPRRAGEDELMKPLHLFAWLLSGLFLLLALLSGNLVTMLVAALVTIFVSVWK